MTNSELRKLLARHTKAQEKANELYAEINCELVNRGFGNEEYVANSIINVTEPAVWEKTMIELIGRKE